MEASAAHPQPPIDPIAMRKAAGRDLGVFEGPGVARLSLMVNTVFGALTAVDGTGSDKDPRAA